MKCQNCGKNEVNFHFSTNINGCVTETYLCSECASKSGYDFEQLFDAGNAFDRFFPVFGGMNGFLPIAFPVLSAGAALPFPVRQRVAPAISGETCSCGHEKCAPDTQGAHVDDEMKKRREINMLREQMRRAAENDDFEKAIELRDKIKEME